jgi:predicted PurR-regulated permease PerM
MNPCQTNEDKHLLFLIGTIYITCIVIFWPLITVLIWSAAIATTLMPFHKQLSRIVRPSVSATFITLWVLLVILLLLTITLSIFYSNIDYIGTMVASLVHGFNNTSLASFLPTFTADQFAHMPNTLVQLMIQSLLSLTSNVVQSLISIIIFFLSLSMLLYYGEHLWDTLTRTLSPKLASAVGKLAEISTNTIYALIIVQISAALISFFLAIPFFFFLGVKSPLLFAVLIGIAMLVPLIGAQLMLLFFTLYFVSLGDIWSALITLVVGYPLLSGWIDFYYRPIMMRRRVAIPPVMMMIGIFAGVPFMGLVGFIVGPVLIALAVTGYKIFSAEVCTSGSQCPEM